MIYLTDSSLRTTALPTGTLTVKTISATRARCLLENGFVHAGDPTCWLVWEAVSNLLGMPETTDAKRQTIHLRAGDKLVIAETFGTDDEETLRFIVKTAPKPLLRFRLLECC